MQQCPGSQAIELSVPSRPLRSFGGELVVLRPKLSMFGKFFGACLETLWRSERRAFYIGSLGAKIIVGKVFWVKLVEILVAFPSPTSFMLTSFGGYFLLMI